MRREPPPTSRAALEAKEKTLQRLLDERRRHATVQDALVDLRREVGALERQKDALARDLASRQSGAALAGECDALRQRTADLRRELERCEALERERRALQVQVGAFRSLADAESALAERGGELARRAEEANGALARLSDAARTERAAVRALEERARAVDPDDVKVRWRSRLSDEVVRLEEEIFELETVVELGEELAEHFGAADTV
jgi:seryl-tRNA synthetase